MPLPAGAGPSPALQGMDLAFFDDLLERSRAHTRRELAMLADADLEGVFHRSTAGVRYELSIGWALYHILEHLAGHYYQIKLLRHQHPIARPAYR